MAINIACSRISTLHLSICFTLVLDKLLMYVCTYLAAVLKSLCSVNMIVNSATRLD